MAATHDGMLRVSSSPGHLQMTCTSDFVALPLTKTIVGVWWLGDVTRKPLQLSGHGRVISAACFGQKDRPLLLCTASEDLVYIWNITKLLTNENITSDHSSGIPVGKDLGCVQHLGFSLSDRLITVCIGKEIWVLNIQTCKLDTLLEGHTSTVTSAQFCPHKEFIIVSTSEDRTFKVWDIEQSCLLYQSAIISAHHFLSLAIDPVQDQMAVGAADGKVRLFDLSHQSGHRCLFELEIPQLLQGHWDLMENVKTASNKGPSLISSQPSWQQENGVDEEKASVSSEAGTAVLALFFIRNPQQPGTEYTHVGLHNALFGSSHSDSPIKDVFHVPSIVAMATTAAIVLVNCNSREPLYILDFQEPLLSSSELDEVQYNISTPGSFAFAERPNGHVVCLAGSLFQNTVNIIDIRLPITNTETPTTTEVLSQRFSQSVGLSSHSNEDEELSGLRGAEMATNTITVLSSTPVCSNSPLKAELVLKTATSQPLKKSSHKGVSKGVRDQALTFHSKIKSSGYSSAPRSKMFSPNTSSSKKHSLVSLRKSSSAAAEGASRKEYPLDSRAPTILQHKIPLAEQPTPINSVVVGGDGKYIACALANKSAHVLKAPPSHKETVFVGHDGSVTSVNFSHDSRWLLTSSCDKTVRLWSPGHSDPLMVLSSVNHNFASVLGGTAKVKDNPSFSKEINQAGFYYVDKFILLACGNGLHMYKYHIDAHKDDVRRYQTNNKYKLVKVFQQERAQQITCFSAINGFHSYIVLQCGSNKSIEVLDMNADRTVRVVLDAHTRPVHTVCQNEGSMFVSHPPSAYDLFLTAAVADGIKLWDLRTNRCVRRYDGHVNRSQPIGLAISPCARFIATGSEDRSAYLYDIRGNTFCHRLTGHTDIVSDVAFHPAHPQLVTASLDGKLRFYSDQSKEH